MDAASQSMPMGHSAPREARLETFGPLCMPHAAWPDLSAWWLRHQRGANTPNWDIAASGRVEGQMGLLLAEGKAHLRELSAAGKPLGTTASRNSHDNHRQIGQAIAEARSALSIRFGRLSIDRDSYYQVSNRIAFAWKLASLGVPVILMYLGFTGDDHIADVGGPFRDDAHWHMTVKSHFAAIGADEMLESRTDTSRASFWVISRSVSVASVNRHGA
jgi:hypothetical protein